MSKPNLLKWVSSDDPLAIAEPDSSKKLAGFIYKEKPPFQYLNWFFNQTYKWFRGLQGNYYDVIIGSAAQVTSLEATHVITDLNDALAPEGAKILILSGSHILTENIVLANKNLKVYCENNDAIIEADSLYKIVFNGVGIRAELRFTITVPSPALEVNGAKSIVKTYGLAFANIVVAADSTIIGSTGILSDALTIRNAINAATGTFTTALTYLGSAVMNLGTAQSFTAQKNFLAVALTWGANVSWNLNTQQVAKLTLTGATAQLDNPTNMIDGGTYSLRVTQDATGGRALTFGTAYKWPSGVVPNLSLLGANEYLRINFESDGTNMDGVAIGPFS